MKILYFVIILLCSNGCKQVNVKQKSKNLDRKLEELVLSERSIGREFFTKIQLTKEILEYKMVYLGSIDNLENGKLRFIYSTTYTGMYEDSKKANSIIAIYNDNERLGQYYVGGGFNKTPIVLKNEIVITYNDENCNSITKLKFNKDIPKKIFIQCNKKNGKVFGDIYNFEEDVKK